MNQKLINFPDLKMLIQVHDELVFEVHESKIEKAKLMIREEMEKALPENYSNIVSLTVDIGVGENPPEELRDRI